MEIEMQDDSVKIGDSTVPVIWKGRVIVVGAGASGVTAAAASARRKIPVLVVEKEGYAGGEAACGGTLIAGAFPGDRSIGGMMDEILAGVRFAGLDSASLFREEDRGIIYGQDNEYFKKTAEEILIKSGCTVMLHTTAIDVLTEGNRVAGLLVSSQMHTAAVLAEAVIDCTAEGCVAAALGLPMTQNTGSRYYHYPYILMNTDPEKVGSCLEQDPQLQKAIATAKEQGDHFGEEDVLWNLKTGVRKNMIYADTICIGKGRADDAGTETRAEIVSRRKMYEHIRFFRKYIPGMENCELFRSTSHVLVEGGRYFQGLTYVERIDCKKLAKEKKGVLRFRSTAPDVVWQELPYGVMATDKYENFLVAGRAISAARDVVKDLGIAGRMAMGQCAGSVAARIAINGIRSTEIKEGMIRSIMDEIGCDMDGDKTRPVTDDELGNIERGGHC